MHILRIYKYYRLHPYHVKSKFLPNYILWIYDFQEITTIFFSCKFVLFLYISGTKTIF